MAIVTHHVYAGRIVVVERTSFDDAVLSAKSTLDAWPGVRNVSISERNRDSSWGRKLATVTRDGMDDYRSDNP